jgi:hypothetical protein
LAFHHQVPIVFKNDLLGRGQTQASAMRFRCKERFEKFRLNLWSDATACVMDANHEKPIDNICFDPD